MKNVCLTSQSFDLVVYDKNEVKKYVGHINIIRLLHSYWHVYYFDLFVL